MDEKTTPKKTRRVGTLAFALVLILAGVLLMLYQIVPAFNLLQIVKFSPVILVVLGIEMLVYSAKPDVLVKFDWLAMLGTAFTLCVVGAAALLPLAVSEWGPARSSAISRIETEKVDALYSALTADPELKAKTGYCGVNVWFNHGADGSYTLQSGSVTNNSATKNGIIYIANNSGAEFTMTKGEISGNTCKNGTIYQAGGTMTLAGGSITGNTAGDQLEIILKGKKERL